MEQEQQQMENCSNCGILLPENKIDLHEAYCIRNCIKCKICEQFYSKDVMEEHVKEDHQNGNKKDASNQQELDQDQNQKQEQTDKSKNILNQQEEQKSNMQEELQENQFPSQQLEERQSSQQEVALLKKLSKKQQTEDGKVRCSNCNKAIVEQKIDMHEGYCIKNCIKCPYCNEFMTEDMIEEHIEQNHVKCTYCNTRIDVNLREAHQKVCLKGGRKCRFCEVSIQLDKLAEHEERCGAQTDNCLYCFKFILKKEMNLHDKICPMKNEQYTLAPLLKQQSVMQQSNQDFLGELKDEIAIFSEQSDISKGQAIYLFNEYGWDLEKSGIYPTLAFAPYSLEEQQQQEQGKHLSHCLVCLQKLEDNNYYSLRCGHRSCNDCFKHWVENQAQNGPLCLDTKCLFDGCHERVGPEGFEKFLNQDKIQKYWGFVQQSALHTHPSFLMCPNPKCQSILKQKNSQYEEKIHMRKKQFNAICDNCQDTFCNLCNEEAHKPLQCTVYAIFKNKKSELIYNKCYKNFLKEQGEVQVIKNNKYKFIENMTNQLELMQIPEQLRFLSFDQFADVYFKSYSLILEASIICQWCNIIDLYQLYPQPVVQIWVEQQLKNLIKVIEKTLGNPEFKLDEFNQLKQQKNQISKLIQDIYSAFQGISQKKNLDPEIVNKNQNTHNHVNQINTIETEADPFQPSQEIQREQQKQQEEIQKIDEEQKKQDQYFKKLTEFKCVECKKKRATIEQYCNKCFNQLYCYNDDEYAYSDESEDSIENQQQNIDNESHSQQNIKSEIKDAQQNNQINQQIEQENKTHEIKINQEEYKKLEQQNEDKQKEQIQENQMEQEYHEQQSQKVEDNSKKFEQEKQQQFTEDKQSQQDFQINGPNNDNDNKNIDQVCHICNSNKSTMDGGYCDSCFQLCFG